LIKSIIAVFSNFQKEPSDKQTASSTYNTFPDDLYLDDQDALEGSGRGGSDNRDDLEASGSGLGPDDEDGDDDGMTSDISREMNFNQSINEPLSLSLSLSSFDERKIKCNFYIKPNVYSACLFLNDNSISTCIFVSRRFPIDLLYTV